MSSDEQDPFAGAQILAVDDDEAKRYAWQRILSHAGFDVSIASTGGEALARLRDNPDLIILDVRLPDMSGTEVCKKIKGEPATSSIPVLHISASLITPEDRTAALEGGADAYLTEPVDPEELVASVKALLRMRRAEEEARQTAKEWMTTFDTIQDGIIVATENGLIARSNRAFQELSGLSPADIRGADLRNLLQQRLGITGIEQFGPCNASRFRRSAEVTWRSRWLRVTFDPVLNNGDPSGCICILSDVTERKTAEQRVHELNTTLEERVAERTQRLQAAIRELEAYSYTIAHDLRAPLRSIHRFSEILLDEYGSEIDEQGHDYTRRIVAGAEKMDALINGLLDYSRLTQSEPHLQPLNPRAIIAEVLQTLMETSSNRIPTVVVDPGLPEVVGDRILLHQVFQNLILNAIKFVDPDRPAQVRISGERRGDRAFLSVTDNGIGIPAESQARLFRVFERLENARDYPGTGIGLAIVRRAVERMGGECGVESHVGKGSRFWLLLPGAKSQKGDPP